MLFYIRYLYQRDYITHFFCNSDYRAGSYALIVAHTLSLHHPACIYATGGRYTLPTPAHEVW